MKVKVCGYGNSLELRCPRTNTARIMLRTQRVFVCAVRPQMPRLQIFDFPGLRITRGAREATIQVGGG